MTSEIYDAKTNRSTALAAVTPFCSNDFILPNIWGLDFWKCDTLVEALDFAILWALSCFRFYQNKTNQFFKKKHFMF